MGRSPPRGRRRRAAHGGKQPRSGADAQQAAAAPPASKYRPLYKSGNVSLSSTGLASKLDRQTKKCMRAARALMKRKLEVRVEASNAGCSVDALADELLADLEADFHRQLEEVRRVEYALKNGQFTEWSLEEALKNSAKSHKFARKFRPQVAQDSTSTTGRAIVATSAPQDSTSTTTTTGGDRTNLVQPRAPPSGLF